MLFHELFHVANFRRAESSVIFITNRVHPKFSINDWTALHMALAENNVAAVELLLKAGADPCVPTRIDDCETPREMAERAGLHEITALIAAYQEQP